MKMCLIDECNRPYYAKGYCSLHYDRWRRTGSPHLKPKPTECSVDGCDLEPRSRGMCLHHYGAWHRRNGASRCSVDGCKRPVKSDGYCLMHYARWRRTGAPGAAEMLNKPREQGETEKACSTCGVVKPVTDFYRDGRYKDRVVARCKACTNAVQRGQFIQYRYGITDADRLDMLRRQEGRCAICREVCGTGQELCVDHDHGTGRVRGLLCRTCNIGLGNFQDEPDRLRAAIQYLTK